MGNTIIGQLIEYMLDPLQDTFSREDAAPGLGRLGNRRVIQAIMDVSENVTKSREAKMLVYALGNTRNPHALNTIKSLAQKFHINLGVPLPFFSSFRVHAERGFIRNWIS